MTAESFFADILSPRYKSGAVLDLTQSVTQSVTHNGAGDRALIISDLHMGQGKRDDFRPNGEMVRAMLEEHYYKNGWTLILNGDIEELAKNSLVSIRREWPQMYRVFDLFAAEGRLFKTLGNHDENLIFEKKYPYPLYNSVRIETGLIPIYVYHGHQSSRVYTDFNNIIRLGIKYLLNPIGIRNIAAARSPRRRFHVERQAYDFSLKNNCISIIGHTHRPLFESLGRFDYIKFEIERHCRDYTTADEAGRERIAREVAALKLELVKLKRTERLEEGPRLNLYGDELPVPCLFNSGSAMGKKGVHAIEVDRDNISLVYWFAEGSGMKFLSRGWYNVEKIAGYCRSALNHDRLDYVKAKIELFSGAKQAAAS